MSQQELLTTTLQLLNRNQFEYMLTGSIASSIHGEPRASHDIDVVINLAKSNIEKIYELFPTPRFYLSETAIREAIEHQKMFNVLEIDSGEKIDFWILSNDEFDRSRFARRQEIQIGTTSGFISTVEDTILMKLKWAKDSGGSSKQLNDVLRMFELQGEALDQDYLRIWSYKLEVADIWKTIMEVDD